MYCTRCGTLLTESANYCYACGQPLAALPARPASETPGPASESVPVPQAPVTAADAAPRPRYAGFWLRLVAFVVDKVVLAMAMGIITAAVLAALGIDMAHYRPRVTYPHGTNVIYSLAMLQRVWEFRQQAHVFPAAVFMAIFAALAAYLLAAWLYYAWMESSTSQGTLGKMLLGIIVTDMQGEAITFGRATGRFFARIVTNLVPFFLGYFMAGFTAKKQALHDVIAGCLVVRKT